MIEKDASIIPEEVSAPLKNMLWSDQRGFFENALGLGGHGLMFVSGPLAILNVVAGLMGGGLSDVGRVIDGMVAGKKPSEIDVNGLAKMVVDKVWPQINASASILEHGIVSLSASQKEESSPKKPTIRFEQPGEAAERRYLKIVDEHARARGAPSRRPAPVFEPAQPPPSKGVVPAPIIFDDDGIVKNQPQNRKVDDVNPKVTEIREKGRVNLEAIQEKSKAVIEQSKLDHDNKLRTIELERKLDAERALDKERLEKSHAEARKAAARGDHAAMEHQIKLQSDIRDRDFIRNQKLSLTKDFISGALTPEQHGVMLNMLDGKSPTERELESARRSGTKANKQRFKQKVSETAELNKQAVKHRKAIRKAEGRNYRMWGAGARRAPGFMSYFGAKVGKAGILAAVIALIYAGIKSVGSDSRFPTTGGAGGPSMAREDLDDAMERDLAGIDSERPEDDLSGANIPHTRTPSNKGSGSISRNINSELDRILGD
jgi:hypothetical protein